MTVFANERVNCRACPDRRLTTGACQEILDTLVQTATLKASRPDVFPAEATALDTNTFCGDLWAQENVPTFAARSES